MEEIKKGTVRWPCQPISLLQLPALRVSVQSWPPYILIVSICLELELTAPIVLTQHGNQKSHPLCSVTASWGGCHKEQGELRAH